MSISKLSSSTELDVHVKSVKSETMNVTGTLTCESLIVTDDQRTSEGNLVIQEGDLILYQSPGSSSEEEREDERKIVFNNGDSGLGGGATCEIGFKGGSTGVKGNIIFRTQTDTSVPPSTLAETMRLTGRSLGIGTSNPEAMLHVTGDIKTSRAMIGLVDTPPNNCPLALNSKGRSSTDGGQMFFEPGEGAYGTFDDLTAININMYQGPTGPVFPRVDKLGWRIAVDNRATEDTWWLDSNTSGSTTGMTRRWLEFDSLLGTSTIGDGLLIDKLSGMSYYVRPTSDNDFDLGSGSFRWKQLHAGTATSITSDATKKRDVAPLPVNRGLSFIKALQPKKYRFIEEESDSGRYHWGLIAQDVESLLSSLGDTDGLGNGLVCRTDTEVDNPDYEEGGEEPEKITQSLYGLRYQELITPLIKAVQQLADTNTTLSAALTSLTARVEELEQA